MIFRLNGGTVLTGGDSPGVVSRDSPDLTPKLGLLLSLGGGGSTSSEVLSDGWKCPGTGVSLADVVPPSSKSVWEDAAATMVTLRDFRFWLPPCFRLSGKRRRVQI